MLSESKPFTTDELFDNLKSLAKRFRKLNGKHTPAELYLVGGASILLNYSFRNMTYDIDALIRASSAMKDAIRDVANEKNLSIDWLNTDFQKTTSYSPNIMKYADYRCELSNVLRIYTISAEYLIAMKLMAARKYKHDLSDIVGIIAEHNSLNTTGKTPITLDSINTAIVNLYGDLKVIPNESYDFVKKALQTTDYELLMKETKYAELKSAEQVNEFQTKYPNVMNCDNVDLILQTIESKSKTDLILDPYYIEVESMEQIEKLKQANITLESKETNDGRLIIRINKSDVDNVRKILNKSKKNNMTI